jgi:hypothetical protein
MRTDKTNASVKLDWHNHLAHEGKFFSIVNIDVVAPGGILSLCVVTPDSDKLIRAKICASASAMMVTGIFEGVTLNDDGTPVVPKSRDRSSANTAPGTWTEGDTGAARGTQILIRGFVSDFIDDIEVALKKNTVYSFILWDIIGTGGAGMIGVDFYQE